MKFIILILLIITNTAFSEKIAFFSLKSSSVETQSEFKNIVYNKFSDGITDTELKQLYKEKELDTSKINFFLEENLKIKYIIVLRIFNITDSAYTLLGLNLFSKPLINGYYQLKIYSVDNKKLIFNSIKKITKEGNLKFWLGNPNKMVSNVIEKNKLLHFYYNKIVNDVYSILKNMSIK